MANLLRPSGRWFRVTVEVIIFGALIRVTRCANFQDVIVSGKIYFVDADCYARMTRLQMVIVGLSRALTPLTVQPLDLGASLRFAGPGRIAALLRYVRSAILVQGRLWADRITSWADIRGQFP